jgi:transcriptional regulator with PAS, ATPase and Fis domain
MAATNQPLRRMVAEGRFREDLYQRLNVFQIVIPPLRERPQDIADQARHFLRRHQTGRDRGVTDFDPLVLEVMRLLPWEGNTRQLENFVWEVLAHKGIGTVVQMEDLPQWVLQLLIQGPAQLLLPGAARPEGQECYPKGLSLNQAMEDFEKRVLEAALKKHGGNRTRTAAELGLTPRSIFNKIKKYGLE